MTTNQSASCWVRFSQFSLAVLGLASGLTAMAELPPPIHSVEISSPRDFGIVMGETLSSEIRIKMEAGYQLEASSLPQPGSAVTDFLEVRKLAWDRQAQGKNSVFQINLTYQVFKGVREPELLKVPAIHLRFNRNGHVVETDAPEWGFTLSPIIPAKTPDEAVILRGDLDPPAMSRSSDWRWLGVCLAGLSALAVYAAWRLGLPPFNRRASPFVRAASGLKKLGKQPATPSNFRLGAKLLHDALNETAGYTLFSGQLEHFLVEHSEYSQLKPDLRQFFIVSDHIFFAPNNGNTPNYSLDPLENLCKKLAHTWGKQR